MSRAFDKEEGRNLEDLVNRLRDLGLSQEQLSEFVGVRRATISGWVHGTVPKLDPAKTYRLCVALECSFEELVQLFQPSEAKSLHELRKELTALSKKKEKI